MGKKGAKKHKKRAQGDSEEDQMKSPEHEGSAVHAKDDISQSAATRGVGHDENMTETKRGKKRRTEENDQLIAKEDTDNTANRKKKKKLNEETEDECEKTSRKTGDSYIITDDKAKKRKKKKSKHFSENGDKTGYSYAKHRTKRNEQGGDAENEHDYKTGDSVNLKTKERKRRRELEEEDSNSVKEEVKRFSSESSRMKEKRRRKKEVDSENEHEAFGKKKEQKKKKKKEKEKVRMTKSEEGEADKSDNEDTKEAAVHPALVYLKSWSDDKAKWHFKKVRQVWLLQNMFNKEKVPNDEFHILLKYLEGLEGKARKETIKKAEDFLENEEDPRIHDAVIQDRVKQVVQILTDQG